MKKLKAQLSAHMFADCPECNEQIDLFDVDCLNEEGGLWHVIEKWRTDGGWENIGMEFYCPECDKEICFDELEY